MCLDGAFAEGQTQASATQLGREKRLEQFRALFGVEARPVVAPGDLHSRSPRDPGRRTADPHLGWVAPGGQGVFQQVAEALLQVERVGQALPLVAPRLLPQLRPFAFAQGAEVRPRLLPECGEPTYLRRQVDG